MQNKPCSSGTGINFSSTNFYWEIDSSNNTNPSTIIFPGLNSFYFKIPIGSYTNFTSANLRFSNFSNNCLIGVKFCQCDLYGANFMNSNLAEADFTKANLECSLFNNSNLINTYGLNKVKSFSKSDFSNTQVSNEIVNIARKKGAKISQSNNNYFNLCSPLSTTIELPIIFEENAEEYQVVIDLVKYADAPNDHFEAIHYYTNILKSDSEDVTALGRRAYRYIMIKEYDKALIDLNKAIEISPFEKLLYINRSYIYIQLNYPEKAILEANKAIKLDSSFADAYNNIGLSYQMIGKLELAIEYFEKALAIDSNLKIARENLNDAYYFLNQDKKEQNEINQ